MCPTFKSTPSCNHCCNIHKFEGYPHSVSTTVSHLSHPSLPHVCVIISQQIAKKVNCKTTEEKKDRNILCIYSILFQRLLRKDDTHLDLNLL